MATYFGEVLPVYSRAVDEDDDEENDCVEFCPTVIKWNPNIKGLCEAVESGKPLRCTSMIIAVGPAASGFAHTYLLNSESDTVAVLCSGFLDDGSRLFEQRQSPTDKSCHLYRSRQSPAELTCVCNSPVTPEQAFSWTTQLFESLELSGAQVAVLSSSVVSDYRTDVPASQLTVPFVRALKTQAFTETPFCPFLEQPNVVNGLPAQILAHLHIKGVKAVLYLCYTDTIFLDSSTMRAFVPILKTTPFKDSVKPNPKADEMLKQIVDLHTTSNTLYL